MQTNKCSGKTSEAQYLHQVQQNNQFPFTLSSVQANKIPALGSNSFSMTLKIMYNMVISQSIQRRGPAAPSLWALPEDSPMRWAHQVAQHCHWVIRSQEINWLELFL